MRLNVEEDRAVDHALFCLECRYHDPDNKDPIPDQQAWYGLQRLRARIRSTPDLRLTIADACLLAIGGAFLGSAIATLLLAS